MNDEVGDNKRHRSIKASAQAFFERLLWGIGSIAIEGETPCRNDEINLRAQDSLGANRMQRAFKWEQRGDQPIVAVLGISHATFTISPE